MLGTLRGRARDRFDGLLRYDYDLRRIVAAWEARLTPLAAAAGEIAPPARVWDAIAGRIAGRSSAGRRTSLAFWRGLAVTSTAFVLALAMAKDPKDRFESGEKLATALEKAALGRLDSATRRRAQKLLEGLPWSEPGQSPPPAERPTDPPPRP